MDHLRITVEAPSGKRREKHLAGASWQKSLIQIRDLHLQYLSKKSIWAETVEICYS